ncbi:MAG TPA: phospholipase, partial [Hymenobacter sp.]
GATWMTREDRLTEIQDYISYLNKLAESLLAACPAAVEITVLGFSQGTATVSRWLAQTTYRPNRLILWAGAFAPDIEPAAVARLVHQLPVVLVCGDQDEYVSAEDLESQVAFLQKLGVTPQVIRFAGQHELNADVLRQLR